MELTYDYTAPTPHRGRCRTRVASLRNLEIGESLGRFWRLWCLFYAGVDRAGVLWRRLEELESKLSFCPYSPMCR
jgi:hypothetical protein